MSFFTKAAISVLCLTGFAAAAPRHMPRACTSGTVNVPEMYNLYPQEPSRTSSAISQWHVETFSNKSQLEQAAVFSKIPAEAKSCYLRWKQAGKSDRTFIVDGSNALVRVRQLSGFPTADVSYTSVKAFDTLDPKTNPVALDLTAWDDIDVATHNGGNIDCAEEIHLLLYLDNPNGNTKALLEQDANNGLYIDYTC